MPQMNLTTPPNVGTRELVRAWLDAVLPTDLAGTVVAVDCAPMTVPSPSFIDELLKVVVVERSAARIRLTNPTPRAEALALRSAQNRHIEDFVEVNSLAKGSSLRERLATLGGRAS
jgi:hypothetical protein